MPYGNLLKKLTKEKKLTYKEIANKCISIGVKIDDKYISQLANNVKPPPSEEKTRAIAKALDTNEHLLIIEGYIDKAPKEILELLNKIREYITLFGLASIKNDLTKEQYEYIMYELQKQSLSEFLIEILEDDDIQYNNNKNFIIKHEGIDFTFEYNNISFIKVKDDSMSPQIEQGSSIVLEIKDKYMNGEILALKIKGNNETIYRHTVFNNGTITLTPYNAKYQAITYNREDVEIIGKVAKVIKEL